MRSISAVFLLSASLSAAEPPRAGITNGIVTAGIYLPDPQNGYYRGTRFDWSGQIYSLRVANHEYFGQWFPKYDPKLHDAIMGPVEEFRSATGMGYAQAKAGGTFVRIGIGTVRKTEEPQLQPFRTYDIVSPGTWRIRQGRDWIEFVHDLNDPGGYSYRYTKTLRLTPGRPILTIEHTLENKGAHRFETEQYNHNFFMIDGLPTGPQTSVQFPFDLKPVRPFTSNLAEARGREIAYTRELNTGESTFAEFDTSPGGAYDIRLENRAAGAGVRIQGDRPVARLVYWAIRTTACPEPYINIEVDPGKKTAWTYTYEFYTLPK